MYFELKLSTYNLILISCILKEIEKCKISTVLTTFPQFKPIYIKIHQISLEPTNKIFKDISKNS